MRPVAVTMLSLRPYQQTVLDTLLARLKVVKHPLLVNASVGAGKSLVIAQLLLHMESRNYRALCLTLSSTLIYQNSNTYKLQGGHPGIYCAGLKSKSYEDVVIFASPHSICQDIKRKKEISTQPFNLIVLDEAHQLDVHRPESMFMRIINHYALLAQSESIPFRVIGLTGTPYRGKGIPIVGPDLFFKEQICDITASYLIANNFLVKPNFGLPISKGYDFSKLRVKNTGKFDESQLSTIVSENIRLTGLIMHEIVSVVRNGRNGAFIFCSTVKHCHEALASLPGDESAVITGETPDHVRAAILEKAKNGQIRYLVSVACLLTGVDVPRFDVIAWLRPTESLVLYIQGIGRGLRLYPKKECCVVLDYAGNLDRHGDIDDPIINDALHQSKGEDDYCIPCYQCRTDNKPTTRRCIGLPKGKRCDYYFEFKPCPKCDAENDKVARHCRECDHELIDPNSKLKTLDELTEVPVVSWDISLHSGHLFFITYTCGDFPENPVYAVESYSISTQKGKNIFYGSFLRKHCEKPSKFYMFPASHYEGIKKEAKIPIKLVLSQDGKIRKKIW